MTTEGPSAGPGSRHVPTRALTALSIALGIVLAALIVADLAGRGPTGRMPSGLIVRIAAVSIVLNIGFVAGPLLVGRGPWRTFTAAVLLAPSVLGWVLMFWPGLLGDPVLGLLGGVSGLVLVVLWAYVFRALAAELMTYRRSGPDDT